MAWKARIKVCADSLSSDVYYKDQADDIRSETRTPTCIFNSLVAGEVTIHNRRAMTKNRVIPASHLMPLVYRKHSGTQWTWDDDAIESDSNGQTLGEEAFLTETEIKDGWRWVRMANPDADSIGDGSIIDGIKTYGQDISDYQHGELCVLMETRVQRGKWDTKPVRYIYEGTNPVLESHLSNQERPLGVESVEYSLNCLFEYNNQTVLMDSSRGKPLHFSNNIRPYNPNTAV